MTSFQKIYLALLCIVIPGILNAQTLQLSIQDALNLAEKNNLRNKQYNAKIKEAQASYRVSNSVFMPQIELSHTGITTNDPLSSFGFKLKQEIVTQADFAPELLNDPGNIENFNTKIEVKQPLLNLDGIYARKAAKKQFEAIVLQSARVKNNIHFKIKKAYYRLELAESSIKVLKNFVKVAEDALRLTKENEVQGFAKRADVLEATVRLEERKNQLLEAEDQRQTAHDYLAHLLGVNLNTQIETTDSLEQQSIPVFINVNHVEIENRSDFQSYKKQIEAGEDMIRSSKMKFVPRINAFGTTEWNDNKISGMSANNYMLGASISWTLFGGYKNLGAVQQNRAKLDEAKYGYQDYLSQSQMQLNNATRKLKLTYNRINSSQLAKEQAQESLRIRTNRFKQGLEKTTDLLMAETLAAQKELEYFQAIYNYKQAIFEMEFLSEKDINK